MLDVVGWTLQGRSCSGFALYLCRRGNAELMRLWDSEIRSRLPSLGLSARAGTVVLERGEAGAGVRALVGDMTTCAAASMVVAAIGLCKVLALHRCDNSPRAKPRESFPTVRCTFTYWTSIVTGKLASQQLNSLLVEMRRGASSHSAAHDAYCCLLLHLVHFRSLNSLRSAEALHLWLHGSVIRPTMRGCR